MGRHLERTTLANVARGLAPQLFSRELARVLEDIADTRTQPQAVRSITLEFKFKPDQDRHAIDVSVDATSKLGRRAGVKGLMFTAPGNDGEEIMATNSDPEQLTLVDELAIAQERRKEGTNA